MSLWFVENNQREDQLYTAKDIKADSSGWIEDNQKANASFKIKPPTYPRRMAQLVEQRSPKPSVEGSSPSSPELLIPEKL